MSDQFENIKNSCVDISQVTFIELISVKSTEQRTFINSSVDNSLAALAHHPDKYRSIIRARDPITYMPVQDTAQKYSYNMKQTNTVSKTWDLFKKYTCNSYVADYTTTYSPEEVIENGTVKGLQVRLQWAGVPRTPVNIFNAFLKVTLRDLDNPRDKEILYLTSVDEGHLEIDGPSACAIGSTIDYWKQNANGGILQNNITATGLFQYNMIEIEAADVSDITKRDNWVWSIPSNQYSNFQDYFIARFDDSSITKVVESIEILLLMNTISPTNTISPNCNATFPVADPASTLSVSIEYTRDSKSKRYTQTLDISEIYAEDTTFSTVEAWDAQISKGNGVKGTYARWESFEFLLDSTAGIGLDQWTTPTSEVVTGSGEIQLGDFAVYGLAEQFEACSTNVIIAEVVKGVRINEVQSVGLPPAQGGYWTLSVKIPKISSTTYTTSAIPYYADAASVQSFLTVLANVGVANAKVTGGGTYSDPFLVEFINDLAGTNVTLMTADGSNLEDVSEYMVTLERAGRYNERQIIEILYPSYYDFKMKFDTQTTIDIPYNASLNTRQAALESLTNIGVGNVYVSGGTTDREADYIGPVVVDFIGTFIGENVATLSVISVEAVNPYKVTVLSQGNEAVWTKQKVSVVAEGGTFTLTVSNPYNPTEAYTTTALDYNASATDVKLALQAAPWSTWGYSYMVATVVKSLSYDGDRVSKREWTIDFTMAWPSGDVDPDGIDVPTMDIDGSLLTGGIIEVDPVSNGLSTAEVQTVTLINANNGSYTLRANLDGVNVASGYIAWNATADEFKEAMLSHPLLTNDNIQVTKLNPSERYETSKYEVYIGGFGDIPLLVPYYEDSLYCVPSSSANAVVSPPYEYRLQADCELSTDTCQTGHVLARPCVGGEEIIEEACCSQYTIVDSRNISRSLKYERDLFDPNRLIKKDGVDSALTVGDMMAIKNLKRSQHVAYKLTGNSLTAVNYQDSVAQGTRLVVIAAELDTEDSLNRIKHYINSKIAVLPSRQT